jgi:hypothetical protein
VLLTASRKSRRADRAAVDTTFLPMVSQMVKIGMLTLIK